MIRDKKHFFTGLFMAIVFAGVLVFMFTPSFNGTNAFHASDGMFNSMAKGSTNYFPLLKEQNLAFKGHEVNAVLTVKGMEKLKISPEEASSDLLTVLQKAGLDARRQGTQIQLKGDLYTIIDSALKMSQAMFDNQGTAVASQYKMPEKLVAYYWHFALKRLDADLKKQKDFKAAKFVAEVVKRGVEVGYNFYGINASKASEKAGMLTFSLLFYVGYTLWWGFAIFFLFEGIGLQMSSGAKKEM